MTERDTIIAIDPGGPSPVLRLSLAEVRQAIAEQRRRSNHALAASISMQLADQLPELLWPQFLAAESAFLAQRIEPAMRYADRGLAIDPGNIACLVIKSRLCLHTGDRAQAMRLIDTAITQAPEDSKLHCIRAELLVDLGRIDDACTGFRQSVSLDPRNADGLLGLAQLPGDNVDEDTVKKIEFIIDSGQMTAEQRIKAHFALAHICDQKGDPARHFRHLTAGNTLKNQTVRFDAGASRREAEDAERFFTPSFFAKNRNIRGNPARIIFIVGFPRCGSTLVEQILSSHPSVTAAGEIFALRQAIRTYSRSIQPPAEYPFCIDIRTEEALNAIADGYAETVQPFDRGDWMTDKALGNYRFVGLIHLMFPNAAVVHVERNAVDTCYSCYKNLFHLDSVPFTYDMDNLANRYRDYRRFIRLWNTILPGKIHTVQYERLVSHQEEVTRALLDFCQLPWDDACLAFHRNARAVQTSSNAQVRRPIYGDSVDRWRIYEKYLGPLLALNDDSTGRAGPL